VRRIDQAKNKKMKGIREAEILDKKRILIKFQNGHEIILKAITEDYGYDTGIYFEIDNIK